MLDILQCDCNRGDMQAVVNEDPNEKMIRNLKSEIEQLRKMLEASGGGGAPSGGPGYDPEAMSTMLVKEREEMRLKFEVEAEAERQRIRAELQEKIRQEMQQSVRWPCVSFRLMD